MQAGLVEALEGHVRTDAQLLDSSTPKLLVDEDGTDQGRQARPQPGGERAVAAVVHGRPAPGQRDVVVDDPLWDPPRGRLRRRSAWLSGA